MASRHLGTTGLITSLVAMCLSVPITAGTVQEDENVRLASPEEGEAIVQAAWELRKGLGPKPDCSHFVRAVYARAGFDYEYATSQELFDGIDSFRRVQKPQPGDLIVWQGHIGIVIDPVEHSFYSSVLSGFAIEDYLSPYWLNRGHPRFYRYLVDSAVSRAGLPAHRGDQQESAALNKQPVLAGPVTSKHDSDWTGSTTGELPTANTTHTSSPSDGERLDVVFVSQAKPSKDEVLAAVVRLADVNGERLALGTSLDSQPNVAVADQFKVIRINITDRSGWADLEIKQAASIQYGFADLRPSATRWRARLRRQQQGWVLLAPQDLIYIRRELAIQVLANHLSVLSRMPANSQEVRRVVRVLDELLAERGASAGAAGLQ